MSGVVLPTAILAKPLQLLTEAQDSSAPLTDLPVGYPIVDIFPAAAQWAEVEYLSPIGPATGWARMAAVEMALGRKRRGRAVANDRFWEVTHEAIAAAVGYGFGVGPEGLKAVPPRIQCSSWVAYVLKAGFRQLNEVAGVEMFTEAALHKLDTYSDALVRAVQQVTGRRLDGGDVAAAALRPGWVVGVDTGANDWEKNAVRPLGIDHVVLVIENPATGVAYVSQSTSDRPRTDEGTLSSGKPGVTAIQLDRWLGWAATRRAKLYAVDAAGLADPRNSAGLDI